MTDPPHSIALMKLRLPCAVLIATLFLSGCGDSDTTDAGQSAAERRAAALEMKIEKKQLEIARLRKEKAAKAKKAAQDAKQAVAAANSDGGLDSYLAGLPGEAGMVVGSPGGDGPRVSGGGLETGSAWSTIKVPISERVLDDFGGPGGISSMQAGEINRAITISDNDAAAALFADLEKNHGGLEGASAAVGEMLGEAGDSITQISTVGRDTFSTYGQTEWALEAQNRYMAALAGGCLADESTTSYLIEQMSMTGGEDSFGIGAAGVPAYWKGGWGPGTDGRYLARQMGVMTVDGKEMVLSLAAIADDGTFESAQAMATEMATWASQNLSNGIVDSLPC